PSYPAYPSVAPPSADQVPDYPPTGGFALGGPPSGPLPIGGLNGPGFPDPRRTGGGFSRSGFHTDDLTSDGYQGGGYGRYHAAPPPRARPCGCPAPRRVVGPPHPPARRGH